MKLPRFRLKLQYKLLALFVLVATLPLIINSILWFNSARTQLLSANASQLTTSASDIANRLENFFNAKNTILFIHSQSEAVVNADRTKAATEFKNFLSADDDLLTLVLIDKAGKVLARVDRDQDSDLETHDFSEDQAFKENLAGRRFISEVYKNNLGQPSIDISIPVVKGKVLGVLKSSFSLTSLWELIRGTTLGKTGYVFLVNKKGNVLVHPDTILEEEGKNLKNVREVDRYLKSQTSKLTQTPQVNQTKNEKNMATLATFRKINATGWGLIAQIPIADTLTDVSQITRFSIILLAIFIISVVLLSSWISGNIVLPIEDLARDAQRLGKGELASRINIKSGDEIETLGGSFNNMAQNLRDAISKLEAERNKLSVALANIADGVIALDLSRNILVFNRAAQQLTGHKALNVLGKRIDEVIQVFDEEKELFPPDYCPLGDDGFEGVTGTKRGLKLVGKKEAFVDLVTAQIKEGKDVNLGCILTLHDITKEKQLEEMKLDFVSMAAHELRTPLTSIRGYLSILIKEAAPKLSGEEKTFLQRINISTEQLRGLIENLLSVSKIEKGVLTLNAEPTLWPEVIDNVIAELEVKAKEKDIKIFFDKQGLKIPKVNVDKLRITEVLDNLLSNAMSYSPAFSTIHIWVEIFSDQVITHIRDNGHGIPKEAIPHLFTKFYRVSDKEQAPQGSGLGLYISKEIIKMHGGNIWVESEEGQGSTFSFSLPVW